MKQVKLILIFLLMISTAMSQKTRVVGTETKKDEPARELKAALGDYRARNYSSAYKKFVNALALIEQFNKNPDIFPSPKYQGNNATKWNRLAAEYAARSAAKVSDFTNADKYFAKAIEFEPENSKTWVNYGIYLFEDRRKSTEATNAFFNVIKFAEPNLSSSNAKKVADAKGAIANANYKLGDIYEKKNQAKAIEYYNKALEINPDYWQPRLKLAKLYEDSKNYRAMEEHFTYLVSYFSTRARSSDKRRQLANAYLHNGMALFNNKKYDDAIRNLNNVFSTTGAKGIQKNAANYFIGMCYSKLKQKSKALASLRKVTGTYKPSADYEIDALENPDKYTN
jgi:tetratricopeptide (TPR) repeat protein